MLNNKQYSNIKIYIIKQKIIIKLQEDYIKQKILEEYEISMK